MRDYFARTGSKFRTIFGREKEGEDNLYRVSHLVIDSDLGGFQAK